jgi:sulfatase modifying factor 1
MKSLLIKSAMFLMCAFFANLCKAQQYPEMVMVVGDTFRMGFENGQVYGDDRMAHKVILASFKIAKTEVTVRQWKEYCQATANPMPAEVPVSGWVDGNPIVNVSWDDAVGYCNWLSIEKGKKFRLPTEAEWEFAARGGSHSYGYPYSGGKGTDMVGWTSENSGGQPHPVASKRANELGLFDMTGNVYEWCSDRFGNYPGKTVLNPKGPATGTLRVYRGGSWYTAPEFCDIASRDSNNPKERFNFVGFRPVEEVEASQLQAELFARKER